jgi:PRTRC genetic system ThiF family protein
MLFNSYDFDVDRFLLDPGHKIKVDLVGVGGTGSQVAGILARMNVSLQAINHPGFDVTIYDPDTVSQSNPGRQLYAFSEVGMPKAQVTANRLNRFFGTDWKFCNAKYGLNDPNKFKTNIVISCVDTVSARVQINKTINEKRKCQTRGGGLIYEDSYPYIWLDFGNGKNYGQAILNYKNGDKETHSFLSMYPEVVNEPETNEPSCSLAAALQEQDLLINSTLGNLGMDLLWKLFRTKKVKYTGVVLNLDTLVSRPIKLKTLKENVDKTRK